MIRLRIHSTEGRLPEAWQEITLQQAMDIFAITQDFPKPYRKVLELRVEQAEQDKIEAAVEELSKEDLQVTLPKLYLRMLKVLATFPAETLEQCTAREVRSLYQRFVERFVLGLLFAPDYEAGRRPSFRFQGRTYYLPRSRYIEEQEIPGVELTALEFTETADLQLHAQHGLKEADKVIAILCRPRKNGKVEPYEEETCLARARRFRQLPMDVVWEVFFCISASSAMLRTYSLRSSLAAVAVESPNPPSTAGTPPWWKLAATALWAPSKKWKKAMYTITSAP